MSKRHLIILVGIMVVVIGLVLFTYYKFGSVIPSINRPEFTPANDQGELVSFLKVPEGFEARYFAKNVPGARVMEWDSRGRMLVSQTSKGTVSVLTDADGDGVAGGNKVLLEGLDSPHGLIVRCDDLNASCNLYVATHSQLLRYAYDPETATVGTKEELLALSNMRDDRHKTRTLLFLPAPDDSKLLISVGSSCNVCHDQGQRGKIIAYDINTKEVTDYATGLRNAVFMTLHPVNGMVFVTEMGRDGLGDDIPPDEVNMIDPGYGIPQNFGWPICYGNNVHDTEFDKNTYIRNPCMHPTEMPAWLNLQAHSAPLGLSFIPEEGWDEDLWFDLVIAYHGSWNRTEPTGYKIVITSINGRGTPGPVEDFITGWHKADGTRFGRPADVKALPGGVLYISDDEVGVIYKVSRIQ